MTRIFSCVTMAALGIFLWPCGQGQAEPIPGGPSKSNSHIVELFKPVVAKAAESTVAVLLGGKQAALGAVVTANGFIVTKESEVTPDDIRAKDKLLTVRFKNGKELPARKVSSNSDWDLALLKVDATNLKPVEWADSKVAPVGNWVATTTASDKPAAIGVVSVAARNMPAGSKRPQPKNSNTSGYLGVMMQDNEDGSGVVLTEISPGSPAEKAGLKAKDVVIAVDGTPTLDLESLRSAIGFHKPGDTVVIRLRRDEKEQELKAMLARRPGNLNSMGDLQNSMGTDRSERRTGFPVALQHDTDLKASQCGGPLVDLEGRVIGINIARGGRTDSYAIPSETLKPLLTKLMTIEASKQEEVKRIEQEIRDAGSAKATADKKITDARTVLEKLQVEVNAAVKSAKDAEEARTAAEKRLIEAKAALDKLQAELKKDNTKK